ncbi:unnamed protein product, partial [Rotaria sp. Silwood1]
FRKKTVKDNFQETNQNISKDGNDDDDDDSMDDIKELYCVACNKSFKSDKAFLNHEKSRKHKEFVLLMKAHIQQENEQLSLNNEDQTNINNDDYDETIQLPTNNPSRCILNNLTFEN